LEKFKLIFSVGTWRYQKNASSFSKMNEENRDHDY